MNSRDSIRHAGENFTGVSFCLEEGAAAETIQTPTVGPTQRLGLGSFLLTASLLKDSRRRLKVSQDGRLRLALWIL